MTPSGTETANRRIRPTERERIRGTPEIRKEEESRRVVKRRFVWRNGELRRVVGRSEIGERLMKAEISMRCDGREIGVRDGGRVKRKWRLWRGSEVRSSPSPAIRERRAKCFSFFFVSRFLSCRGEQ